MYPAWDLIVVGAGLAGSVLTSRLIQQNGSLKILLVEAGPDRTGNSSILYTNNTSLVGSELDWGYTTVPQVGMGGRSISNPSGKGLGGGTLINGCVWIRGDRSDYDLWAELVGDDRWGYNGMLPYFRKTEHTWNMYADKVQHGFDGNIWSASISSTGRKYPLRELQKEAWEAINIQFNNDINIGSPQGIAELEENRRNGLRQVASSAYPLSGVDILTNTLVNRVLIEDRNGTPTAVGVELANGTKFTATKEVIVSAGVYRTPQILMLSGIGPEEELTKHGISQVVNAPEIGLHLRDHIGYSQIWKLEHPEQGLAIGSSNPLFSQPEYSTDGLEDAIIRDGSREADLKQLLRGNRTFSESGIIYVAGHAADPYIPTNGSYVTTSIAGLLLTSEGSIKLQSTDPNDDPLIDPNYYSTEVDRFVFRSAVRQLSKALLGTEAGKAFINSEVPLSRFEPIQLNSSDTAIDARIQTDGISGSHAVSTASMGKVVDTNLKVYGVDGLRVVDASVVPNMIAAHLQQAIYALAEQAADIITGDLTTNI